MARKTEQEVKDEIAALRALDPQHSNAKNSIGIAIRVLEDGLSVDDVYEEFDEEGLEFMDAHSAVMWREGDAAKSPSEEWKESL